MVPDPRLDRQLEISRILGARGLDFESPGVPRGRFWEPLGINLVGISDADFPPSRTSFFKAATYITRLRVIPLRLREVFQTLLLGP